MKKSFKILFQAIETLGGQIENEVTSRTTHVVSPNIDRTMNVLRGVIRACLIINPKWIHDSIENNKWLETSPYQFDIVDSHRVRKSISKRASKVLTFHFLTGLRTIHSRDEELSKFNFRKSRIILFEQRFH